MSSSTRCPDVTKQVQRSIAEARGRWIRLGKAPPTISCITVSVACSEPDLSQFWRALPYKDRSGLISESDRGNRELARIRHSEYSNLEDDDKLTVEDNYISTSMSEVSKFLGRPVEDIYREDSRYIGFVTYQRHRAALKALERVRQRFPLYYYLLTSMEDLTSRP